MPLRVSTLFPLLLLAVFMLGGCATPESSGRIEHPAGDEVPTAPNLTALFEQLAVLPPGTRVPVALAQRQTDVLVSAHYFSASGKQCTSFLETASGQRHAVCRDPKDRVNHVSLSPSTEPWGLP